MGEDLKPAADVRRAPSVARLVLLLSVLLVIAFTLGIQMRGVSGDWRTASREPAGLAPDPATTREPVVQAYAARTWGWKGLFGVHTWIAVKPAHARSYTVYEVIGWRLRWGDTVLVVRDRAPDERWYGSMPELLADKRGPGVADMIARIDRAAREYPYAGEYTLWPGPNSNTFTAWIGRAVPELELDLPATAIGKDYLGSRVVATPPSGRGLQLSVFGLLGFTASAVEGLEINVLGLTFGVNPLHPSLNLPLVGRVGRPH